MAKTEGGNQKSEGYLADQKRLEDLRRDENILNLSSANALGAYRALRAARNYIEMQIQEAQDQLKRHGVDLDEITSEIAEIEKRLGK